MVSGNIVISVGMMVIFIRVRVMIEVERNVAEQHVMVRMMANEHVFDIAHRTGHSGLGEDEHECGA